jgi:hypothetical protein
MGKDKMCLENWQPLMVTVFVAHEDYAVLGQ